MTRDPRTAPHEGDELTQRNGTLRLLVDGVLDGVVLYRVVDSQDGLLGAWRVPLSRWREIAAEQCEGVREAVAGLPWVILGIGEIQVPFDVCVSGRFPFESTDEHGEPVLAVGMYVAAHNTLFVGRSFVADLKERFAVPQRKGAP